MPTSFLYAAGTNGYIAAPFDLLTTELNGITYNSLATLGGALHNNTTVQAIFGEIYFTSGGTWNLSAVNLPYLPGWFVRSPDGGTSYEDAAQALARAPDFSIPLPQVSISSGKLYFASGTLTRLPPGYFKTLVANYGGATLPSTGNKISCAPFAAQY